MALSKSTITNAALLWQSVLAIAVLVFLTACASGSERTADSPPTIAPTSTPQPTIVPLPQPNATPEPTPAWELVWQDEFDGPAVDDTKWSFEVNGKGGGNNELQFYTDKPENAYIENGMLVIEAREEKYIGRNYTSARMRTVGKGDWMYGRFEFRAKMPEGQGLWPAIWMLPSEWRYGGWPNSGEIDIMELLGHQPHKVHGTLHYGGSRNHQFTGKSFSLTNGNFSDAFHDFALEWEESEMRWYVDGEHYQTQTSWNSTDEDFPAPFDQPFHLILNVAVGGNWPESPDETTVFPQQMVIDYARVYQRSENE